MVDGMAKVGCSFTRVGRGLVPWCCLGGGELLGSLAAGVGEARHLLALLIAGRDQTLVVQQLDGRVDRAGAGAPRLAAALANLLDHLVAMHRPVKQEQQGCGAHIAPAASRASAHRRIRPEAHSGAEAHTASTAARASADAEAASDVVLEIVLIGSWIHRVLRSGVVDALTIYRYCIVDNLHPAGAARSDRT